MRLSSVSRRSSLELLSMTNLAQTEEEGQRLLKALSSSKVNSIRKFGLYCQDWFGGINEQQLAAYFQWLAR